MFTSYFYAFELWGNTRAMGHVTFRPNSIAIEICSNWYPERESTHGHCPAIR